MNHTPGPWAAMPSRVSTLEWVICADPGSPILRVRSLCAAGKVVPHGESEGNARLVAAAPDLLQALRDLLQVIEHDQLIPESVSYMRLARAAMAKAEIGEVQP